MIRIMQYTDGRETWRAACLTDGQNDLCLTGPELAHLEDDALLEAAQNVAYQHLRVDAR